MIKLPDDLSNNLEKFFLSTFPEGAISGEVRVYYGDAYIEYPITYLNDGGDEIVPTFDGWDGPSYLKRKKLIEKISLEVVSSRKGLKKQDPNYWNLFVFNCGNQTNSQYFFLYDEKLDEEHEAEVRKSIGDSLYEKYQSEKK